MNEIEILEQTNDDVEYRTGEVAEMLDMKITALISFLRRHRDLLPAKRPAHSLYLWTMPEIERLREFRSKRKRYAYKTKP